MGGGGTEVGYRFTIFFACASVIFSLTLSVPFFRWLEHNGCCLCFFDFTLFLLWFKPL